MCVELCGGITNFIYSFMTLYGFVELESFGSVLKSEIMGEAERKDEKRDVANVNRGSSW